MPTRTFILIISRNAQQRERRVEHCCHTRRTHRSHRIRFCRLRNYAWADFPETRIQVTQCHTESHAQYSDQNEIHDSTKWRRLEERNEFENKTSESYALPPLSANDNKTNAFFPRPRYLVMPTIVTLPLNRKAKVYFSFAFRSVCFLWVLA